MTAPEPKFPDDAYCDVAARDPAMASAWIQEDHDLIEDAKRFCKTRCKVRDLCLQDALLDEEAEGIRGGFWFDSGRLPVADARKIRDEGFIIGEHQSTGRPKA